MTGQFYAKETRQAFPQSLLNVELQRTFIKLEKKFKSQLTHLHRIQKYGNMKKTKHRHSELQLRIAFGNFKASVEQGFYKLSCC